MEKLKLNPKWEKTKEEIWSEKFEEFTSSTSNKRQNYGLKHLFFALSSVAAILIVSLILFSTTSYQSKSGETIDVVLPDGSKVVLNENSSLSYNRILWSISRKVEMNGEAFFVVEKGKKFTVNTNYGNIEVLGTEFNVFSRVTLFEVLCYSGKVAVISGDTAVIRMGESVTKQDNKLILTEVKLVGEQPEWIDRYYKFEAIPLSFVVSELSKNLNITIELDVKNDYLYTGKFLKEIGQDDMMQIISSPFNLKVEKTETGYKIFE